MLIDVALLVVGLILLVVGGDLLVRGASNLAYSLQISPLVVGLTVVAFGTSAPELLVSIKAAMDGAPDISMGNIIGSNICNLSLVLGATAAIFPIYVHENSIKIDWPMAFGASLLLYFFISYDFVVQQFEGIIFILILAIYTYFLIEMSRRETIEKMLEENDGEEIPEIKGAAVFRELGILALGGIVLYFGSEWFVGSAESIATLLGVSEKLIGLTVIAIGTSLPELVTSVIAASKKETDLAVGNLLGSNIFNVLSILGVTSIIKDISVNKSLVDEDMLVMLGITLLVFVFMIYRKKVTRIHGLILLAVYFSYTAYLIITA